MVSILLVDEKVIWELPVAVTRRMQLGPLDIQLPQLVLALRLPPESQARVDTCIDAGKGR